MAMLLRVLCLFAASVLIAAVPIKDLTERETGYVRNPLSDSIETIPHKRDADYVRNPLSDWDTPLPARDDEAIEPVPQADLKH
ncbi:hypothetical protein NHQ30_005442 [Ciborinia camelliae]|nr:hypothetical protein NHQ30_005442 [Ciborinia camelliae]